jgi:hypothetical protein
LGVLRDIGGGRPKLNRGHQRATLERLRKTIRRPRLAFRDVTARWYGVPPESLARMCREACPENASRRHVPRRRSAHSRMIHVASVGGPLKE